MKVQISFICIFIFAFFSNPLRLLSQGPYPNTGNHQVCLNASEPYGVLLKSGSTYLWRINSVTGANGVITAGTTPNLIIVNWTSIGTALLQVIETNAGGCSGDTMSIMVTVNPEPVLVVHNPAAVCFPGTVDITAPTVTAGSTAGIALTYWIDATATTAYTTPSAATAGTYYIKATSAAGCFEIQPVTVTVNSLPDLTITNPAPVCSPNTADITAASVTAGSGTGLVLTYWTDPAATVNYTTPTTATAGIYYIKATSAAGCSDIKPVIVTVNTTPSPSITGNAAVCQTANNSMETYSTPNNSGHTYLWTVTGGNISFGSGTNMINVSWANSGPGLVRVIETDAVTGCSGNVWQAIDIKPKPATTPITHN